jgi:hypothetical protein
MYVITDHNNDANFVILGPIDWKPRYISDILSDEFDEDIVVTQADEQKVPYEPYPGVKIRKCITTFEDGKNSKIETLAGPFWTYDDDNTEVQAVASWVKQDKPIDLVKGELRDAVAAERWKREIKGITLTIQDTDVWCDTSRGNRDIFLQKYVMMGEADVARWKFPNCWLDLTKNELGHIVSEGSKYIQECFDWESDKNAEIDSCVTLQELDLIQIGNEEETPKVL